MREGYQLRQDVCEALLARRQELEPFIVGRFDVYVDNMMREGSWGGAVAVGVQCLFHLSQACTCGGCIAGALAMPPGVVAGLAGEQGWHSRDCS